MDVLFLFLYFILVVNVKMYYICIFDWNFFLKEENLRKNIIVNDLGEK